MPNALTRLRQEDLDINIKQLSNILWIMCSAFLSFLETLYVKNYILTLISDPSLPVNKYILESLYNIIT